MNLLDFECEFKAGLEFIGDNECDYNLLTIKRFAVDNYGHEIKCEQSYCMSKDSLQEIAIGLEAMAKKIRDYLNQ